jgi:uncharacterized spore protein YtfJ
MELDKLHATLESARDAITVSRVFGDPIERDGTLIIPAAAVRGGGGGGGGTGSNPDGSGEGEGQGVGFGMDARPVGAFIVRDGDVRWEPAIDRNRQIATAALVAVVALLTLRSLLHRRRR